MRADNSFETKVLLEKTKIATGYNKSIFARRLRQARVNLRHITITKKQLAEKSGIHCTQISHYENLKLNTKPSLDNLIRLANALEVTTDYLLGRSNKPEEGEDDDNDIT